VLETLVRLRVLEALRRQSWGSTLSRCGDAINLSPDN
jgi:hypothetical protein